MQRVVQIFAAIIMAATACIVHADDDDFRLELLRALKVNGPFPCEPSGLVMHNGVLYCVSDKQSNTIFRVKMDGERAVLEPAVQFQIPDDSATDALDLEGIAVDDAGDFLLVSESTFRVLRVSPDGTRVSWVTDSVEAIGEAAGLFATDNAYLEGITYLGNGCIVLSAERQPCGLLTIDINTTPPTITATRFMPRTFSLRPGRTRDITDLCYIDDRLYALQRNAEAVSMLTIDTNGVHDDPVASFRLATFAIERQYRNMIFGMAEGLAMDKEHIYIILDNNGIAQKSNPDDFSPYLFIFKRPPTRE